MTDSRDRAKRLLKEVALQVMDYQKYGVVEALLHEVRAEALIEGVTMYAWWKDGEQWVGSCGTTLKEAIKKIKAKAEEEK